MLYSDTIAFKLSYKRNWKKENNGKTTYYNNLINNKEIFS